MQTLTQKMTAVNLKLRNYKTRLKWKTIYKKRFIFILILVCNIFVDQFQSTFKKKCLMILF